MESSLLNLITASAAFVGTHFIMSHPLRAPMVKMLGDIGFQVAYSVVSLATMAWMYFAFKATPATTPLWPGFDDISWAVGSIIVLLGMVLFAGSLIGNPAMPAPNAADAARKEPHGVFRVTRHPMLWGFSLWGVSHMIAAPTGRTLVVALAIIVLSLVGAKLQDAKKRTQMGEAWAAWESKTSYWPRLGQLGAVGWKTWLAGIAIWFAASWAHGAFGGMDAGVFRWL